MKIVLLALNYSIFRKIHAMLLVAKNILKIILNCMPLVLILTLKSSMECVLARKMDMSSMPIAIVLLVKFQVVQNSRLMILLEN